MVTAAAPELHGPQRFRPSSLIAGRQRLQQSAAQLQDYRTHQEKLLRPEQNLFVLLINTDVFCVLNVLYYTQTLTAARNPDLKTPF